MRLGRVTVNGMVPHSAPFLEGKISPWVLITVTIAGVGLRLWLAAGHYGNYDQTSFQHVAGIAVRGGNIYAETSRYNYSPVWGFLLAILARGAGLVGISLHLAFRGFLSFVDLLNAFLIGGIAHRASKMRTGAFSRAYTAYLLNPVAILIVGYHGQFDNLAALPLLAAVYSMLRKSSAGEGLIWALATSALLIKHLCVFAVWTVLLYLCRDAKRAALLMASSLGVFLLSFVPYLPDGYNGILHNVLFYGGIQRPYGLTMVLPRVVAYPIFLAAMVLLPVYARRRGWPLLVTMAAVSVGLLLLIPGTGEAYFILPVIWGSVLRGPGFWAYTLVAYVFLLSGPNNLQVWSGFLPWSMLWAALAFWGYWIWRDLRCGHVLTYLKPLRSSE